jgi:cell cycle arrest protein BUB2
MANLELLLQRGPSSGELNDGLEQLRYAVLTDGIPSNSDGMVRHLLACIFIVRDSC